MSTMPNTETIDLPDVETIKVKDDRPMLKRLTNARPFTDLGVLEPIVYDDPRVEDYAKKTNSLRIYVRSAYRFQKLRIALGNRICATFRYKLGLQPSQKESEDAQASKILKTIREEYDTLMDGILELPTTAAFFKNKEGNITQLAELMLLDQYEQVVKLERQQFDMLATLLEEFPIYTEFLSKIYGIGPAMAAVIVSEINIYKAKYPSSLERLTGIDTIRVVDNVTGEERDEGRSNREAHLVIRTYVDKNGETKTKRSIAYNPFLKTKVMGVLAPILIKIGKSINKETGEITYKNKYAKVFDDYRSRKRNEITPFYRTPIHIRNMSMRYMIKAFYKDLYDNWRALEGLPVHPPYAEAKLGMNPHKSPSTT